MKYALNAICVLLICAYILHTTRTQRGHNIDSSRSFYCARPQTDSTVLKSDMNLIVAITFMFPRPLAICSKLKLKTNDNWTERESKQMENENKLSLFRLIFGFIWIWSWRREGVRTHVESGDTMTKEAKNNMENSFCRAVFSVPFRNNNENAHFAKYWLCQFSTMPSSSSTISIEFKRFFVCFSIDQGCVTSFDMNNKLIMHSNNV